jgi:hypothetical protein
MTKLDDLLSTVGPSDYWERVGVKKSSGMSEDVAKELVGLEMISETHSMTKALLLMFGKQTGQMSDAEATLAQR